MSEGARSPNELFENKVRQGVLQHRQNADKYSVAMYLLNAILPTTSQEQRVDILNAILTEYPDREMVEQVEFVPAYLEALRLYVGKVPRVGLGLIKSRNAAWVPFERKREGAVVDVLREGEQKADEMSTWRKLLGEKDDV